MLDDVSTIVEPSDFYAPLHETIYAAIVALGQRGAPIDTVSLADELRLRGMLDKVGGMGYLAGCTDVVASASSAAYYARLIREKAQLRGLIFAGQRISTIGYQGETDAVAAIEDAAHVLTAATERGLGDAPLETVFDILNRVIGVEARVKDSRAITLPWRTVNRTIGSCMPGELVAIVSGPAIGKSGVVRSLLPLQPALFEDLNG